MQLNASDYLIFDEASGTYIENPEQKVRDDVEKHHWGNVFKAIIKDWRLYLMLLPMIAVFLLWRYAPMYELLECFKLPDENKSVAQEFYIGFSNFKRLLFGSDSANFWNAFRNTFLLSFYGLLFGFPTPIIVALFFNEIRSNVARSLYQVITYLPKFMSTVVMTSLIIMLVSQANPTAEKDAGIVSQFLNMLGLISPEEMRAGLLNDPRFFRSIYQLSGIWEGAGYDSIVFFAAIIAISPTSYEAAQIDGAGKMAQMRYVVLPSILSTVVIMLITRIGSLLSVGYEKVYLLTDTGSNTGIYVTADVVSTYALRLGINGTQKGLASAAEMMNNVVGMLLVIGANTISRRASNVSLY